MYPKYMLDLYPPFPNRNTAFIAMSFNCTFDHVFSEILIPAIKSVAVNGSPLIPYRVDLERKSDAIITDIIQNISECTIFIGDITSSGRLEESGRPYRNANVMYEIGIAHAVRLPEEVILLRSDRETLDFDIQGVRIQWYDRERIDESRALVEQLIRDSLDSIASLRRMTVERIADSLDVTMLKLMHDAFANGKIDAIDFGGLKGFFSKIVLAGGISGLLDRGLIRAVYRRITPANPEPTFADTQYYELSDLGRAVWAVVANRVRALQGEKGS